MTFVSCLLVLMCHITSWLLYSVHSFVLAATAGNQKSVTAPCLQHLIPIECKASKKKKRKDLSVLAKTESRFLAKLSSSNVKAVALPRAPEN